MQIHTPAHLPAALEPSLPEAGRLTEVDPEQELLDGFLAKLQTIIRGGDSRRLGAGDDGRPARDQSSRS